MTQNENPRLHFGDRMPLPSIPELRKWFENQPTGRFTRAEREIYSAGAVAWADPARPTMAQAYRVLCYRIDEDASFGGVAVRKPSPATFRKLIRTLPPGFVLSMRMEPLQRVKTFARVSAGPGHARTHFQQHRIRFERQLRSTEMKLRKLSEATLNRVIEIAMERAGEEISFREANGYPTIEQQVLEMAIATACTLPGNERGVWELMANEVAEMNVRLKRDGHPPLNHLSFDQFRQILAGPFGESSVH